MLTKGPKYWWDQEAVREPNHHDGRKQTVWSPSNGSHENYSVHDRWPSNGRNLRNVWEFPTEPYPEAHFAVFPTEIPRRCILAACPEQICVQCGKARERVVEIHDPEGRLGKGYHDHNEDLVRGQRGVFPAEGAPTKETIGWTDCGCNAGWRPGLVLDPFGGAGTTAMVAQELGRRSVHVDLSEEYCQLAIKRLEGVALPMRLT